MTTLHDMIQELYPSIFEQPEQERIKRHRALRRAKAIICVSENTRRDLVAHYPEFGAKAHVVWHGVDHIVSLAPRPQDRVRPYLLFVGMRQSYKNFDRFLQAIGASRELASEFDLLCFGGGSFTAEERTAVARSGLRAEQVLHIEGDDARLASAYRHARLFVYPSEYEGFGMPLTEAMVQGCPIACSSSSCFPEILGDAGITFDPLDVVSMRCAIESAALNDAVHDGLAARSAARAAVFSWERCARETAAVYRLALQA